MNALSGQEKVGIPLDGLCIFFTCIFITSHFLLHNQHPLLSWPFLLLNLSLMIPLLMSYGVWQLLFKKNFPYSTLIFLLITYGSYFFFRIYQMILYVAQFRFLSVLISLAVVIILGWFLEILLKKIPQPQKAKIFLIFLIVGTLSHFLVFPPNKHKTKKPNKDLGSLVVPKPADNIYYLFLDEHLGLDGFPDLPSANHLRKNLLQFYTENGFLVYSRAYSNYYWTRSSMASILNNEPFNESMIQKGLAYKILKNKNFERWVHQGYNPIVFQEDYGDYCNSEGATVSECYIYPLCGLGYLRDSNLTSFQRYSLIFIRFFGNIIPSQRLFHRQKILYLTNALVQFKDFMKIIPNHREGSLIFLHSLLSHIPFVLDEKCQLKEELLWDLDHKLYPKITPENYRAVYTEYFKQVQCAQSRISEFLELLKKEDLYEQATIIIHSDHGSRLGIRSHRLNIDSEDYQPQDFRDNFSAFLAIKPGAYSHGLPQIKGQKGMEIKESISIANVFRQFFGLPISQDLQRVYDRSERRDRSFEMRGWVDP